MNTSIEFVATTLHPMATTYLGRIVASRGVIFDWPSSDLDAGNQLLVWERVCRGAVEHATERGCWISAPGDTELLALGSGREPLLVTCVPKESLRRRSPARKQLTRYGRASTRIVQMLRQAAKNAFMREALVHGLVGANAKILGSVEAIESGGVFARYAPEIKHSCFHITSLVVASKIIDPNWVPILDGPWNRAHSTLLSLCKSSESEFRRRRVVYVLGECYAQIRMESAVLAAVLHNIVSNAVKYAEPDSTVDIIFERATAGSLLIKFAMSSAVISSDVLEQITAIGSRGTTKGTGSGIGLALVSSALVGHGGHLRVMAGTDQGRGYANNEFVLEFPSSIVRWNE